ncbi:hypothetical protein Ade02nite_41590 [Paractinoplanes deccanensis]|uniref:DUF4097 domain-containing protein n=1 Tax=Paractinoplanes deccanensis TaxID=113561 RepID=A0ABQ3Y695_9ACTN|nr:DUF4097 family beta strand repeat-containing protein [Actinoplanes deccanensis]GID75518.1 hypothetical protein Ade02nite_41590 [Actinoplanes deccanensis]
MTTTLARRTGILVLIGAATASLTACGGVLGATLTYNDVEKTKITEIRLTGGAGDVAIATADVSDTTIKRVIRNSSDPGESYRVAGSTLYLDTSCGADCNVSYEVKAPAGVAVRGDLRSGDVHLQGAGTTDLQLTSGDINVLDAAGPVALRATSGDIRVVNAADKVTVQSTSGEIDVLDVAGPVDLKVTSGDITAALTEVADVKAQTTSGDVNVRVPQGSYKIVTHTGSGDAGVHDLLNDPKAKNTIDLRTSSGDATVTATP